MTSSMMLMLRKSIHHHVLNYHRHNAAPLPSVVTKNNILSSRPRCSVDDITSQSTTSYSTSFSNAFSSYDCSSSLTGPTNPCWCFTTKRMTFTSSTTAATTDGSSKAKKQNKNEINESRLGMGTASNLDSIYTSLSTDNNSCATNSTDGSNNLTQSSSDKRSKYDEAANVKKHRVHLSSSSSNRPKHCNKNQHPRRQKNNSFQQSNSNKNYIRNGDRNNRNHSNTFSLRHGTQSIIKPTNPLPHPLNHPLAPYISYSLNSKYLPSNNNNTNTTTNINTDNTFNIIFLGTSGIGRPTILRNQSSTSLKIHGKTFIFDVGENTQKQMTYTKNINVLDINKIFITHLHIDHVGGLIPLILNTKLSLKESFERNQLKRRKFERNKRQKEAVEENIQGGERGGQVRNEFLELEIYGPVGLYNYIAMNLALTHSNIFPVKIIVYELVNEYENDSDDTNDKSKGNRPYHHRRKQQLEQFKLFDHDYPECKNPYLERKKLYKNKQTNTWMIQQNQHSNVDDNHKDFQEQKDNGKHQYAPDREIHKYVTIEAAEVQHVENVQTFGYVITEPTPQPKIDVKKAITLGVKPSPKYKLLKLGQKVRSDDDTEWIHPHQVMSVENHDDNDVHDHKEQMSSMKLSKTRKGRKLVYIGDTCNVPESMINISQNCDVLIHEATLMKDHEALARKRGHSTAEMAGRVARKVNAKVLLLNHIGARNDQDQRTLNEVVKWSEYGYNDSGGGVGHRSNRSSTDAKSSCLVVVSYDFMEMKVPRNGFELA